MERDLGLSPINGKHLNGAETQIPEGKKGDVIYKSVTPQMFNVVQRTWQNKFTGKPNYGFNHRDPSCADKGSGENK